MLYFPNINKLIYFRNGEGNQTGDTMKIKYIIALLFVLAGTTVSAQKDTLFFPAGDVMYGEIKSLNKNVLIFDTDYADADFKIEWDKVDGVVANSLLIIYLESGKRYKGYLRFSGNTQRIISYEESTENYEISLSDIVAITTLDENFWSRINISLDAGFSFSKANNLAQLTTNNGISYKSDKWKLSGTFNSVYTNQDDVEATKRNEGKTGFTYDVLGKLFAFVGMEFLKNSEQNLDLRTTSKGGMGYYVIRNNRLYLQGGIGLANANERYGGDDPSNSNSFEGLGLLEFDAFDIGDFSFTSKVSFFPSLSHAGRIRINGDVSLKWNLPLDFYIKASYSHDFDSQPLVDVPKNDFVFQTSFGWEWD